MSVDPTTFINTAIGWFLTRPFLPKMTEVVQLVCITDNDGTEAQVEVEAVAKSEKTENWGSCSDKLYSEALRVVERSGWDGGE